MRILAHGTGQALATAARGDADLVLVHDPEAEQQFIAEGHGAERRQIAWNDFIVIGPRADPCLKDGRESYQRNQIYSPQWRPQLSRHRFGCRSRLRRHTRL